jgi:hypothetical protein
MFKEMFKYVILIIGITLLVVLPASAADQTDIIITRTNSSTDSNRPVTVYIDDIRVGTIMPGRRLETRVNNGNHTILAKITPNNNTEIITDYYFTADDTKIFYFRINVSEVEEQGLIFKKKVPAISITLVED